MARNEATKIELSEKQRKILTQMQVGTHSPHHLKQRAEIVILADNGNSNNEIERIMKIGGETITMWRNRYALAQKELEITETETPLKLRKKIEETLSDAPRRGRPPTFTDEQVACIIAMSCQKPEKYGLPFSHWTPSLLKEEVIKRGIVTSISTMQISRFLKRERFKAPSS